MVQVAFVPFAFPGVISVSAVFTSRLGGASRGPFAASNLSFDVGDEPSAVLANRRELRERLGFETWTECRQVHGETLLLDPEPGSLEEPGTRQADAMATARPGQALVIKTADCQPILFAHKSGQYIAAVHAGWRGNRMNLPGSAARRFCEAYGLDPLDVLAVRGPSLGPASAEFTNFHEEFGPEFEEYYDHAARTVDLWRLTRDQLVGAGLSPENVFGLEMCTRTMRDEFFSYRRNPTTGRQAGIIWIHP
ncbi:MAG: polyphenol oxidase family protein [Desulfovibrio aminophilus]|uniref:polyphenol oxidase family protein n=1 Tax=Desulfovibrio aminophilus TaxID=81425 RepID=UPI002A44BB0B|nr:polyphenol oxidase family protein [Desulfovibrionaceae bacterium]